MTTGIVLGLGIFLYSLWTNYTSPISEAGRAFRDSVRTYRNDNIETTDDIYERLDVLDDYYQSPVFDNVQEESKGKVTLSDIKILLGDPHEVIEKDDLDDVDTQYNYTFDNITINFNEYSKSIDEYVVEHFSETVYEPDSLDDLFINTVTTHHTQKTNESKFKMNETPTRKIRQSGWRTRFLNQEDYFDDGQQETPTSEYLVLQYYEEDEKKLYYVERQYDASFPENDTQEEHEKMREMIDSIQDLFDQIDLETSDERVIVEDFSNRLGEIVRILYDSRLSSLNVTWLVDDGELINEITAKVHVTDDIIFSELNDLQKLKVAEYQIYFYYRQ